MAVREATDAGTLEIAGLTCDSREAAPGMLFAALPGETVDGRTFIPQALEKGASAVLAPLGTRLPDGYSDIPLITDDNPRKRFALMAAAFYGRQPETVVAVTGTNGKTSVAGFARQIWAALGRKAGSVGTLGIDAPGMELDSALTTPDPAVLHRNLAALADGGVTHLAMEASSHGLAQYRLDGVKVKVAAFTNLSRDHLDYHGGMDDYLAAKMRLFTEILDTDGVAVINADSDYASTVIEACAQAGIEVRTYGEAGQHVRIAAIEALTDGQRVTFDIDGQSHDVTLGLVGRFQVSNVACALAVVVAGGEDGAKAAATLGDLKGMAGRMEFIGRHRTGASIYVDYAHTPDALANALESLRPHTRGWLHVVFGCGGDRDKGKRPLMGRVCCDMADAVIVTDDNPRSESPEAIRKAILTGCARRDTIMEIGDRSSAIHAAIHTLETGDVLLVAGKGHETGQIVGDKVYPFDDAGECRKALAKGVRA